MSAQAQVIPINQEVELEQKTLTLYEQATGLVITDQPSYVAAGEVGKGLKALEKEIVEYHEPLRIAAKASYDAVLKRKNDDLAPVTEAMGIVRDTMNAYAREQELIRREEERKAQAKSDEKASKEREKLEVQALAAMEKGKDERAEYLLEKAEMVYAAPVTVAPVVSKTVKTASGNITQAKELKVAVTNPALFLKTLCEQNPGAVAAIMKIGDGPLKSFVKSNGLVSYPGLTITHTVGVRL